METPVVPKLWDRKPDIPIEKIKDVLSVCKYVFTSIGQDNGRRPIAVQTAYPEKSANLPHQKI